MRIGQFSATYNSEEFLNGKKVFAHLRTFENTFKLTSAKDFLFKLDILISTYA